MVPVVEITVEQRGRTYRRLTRHLSVEGVFTFVQPQPTGSLNGFRV